MSTQEKKNYALPIAVMFGLFFMIAFVTGLPSPMGVIVAKQFGATNFESQLGFFANFIAYLFMGLPAGWMLKKIGYKKTAIAAVIVGFVGVGVQFLSGQIGLFSIYIIGAFISGFSMCMLNTVVNPMLNTLGGGGNKGNQLIQWGGSINSIAATLCPMLVGYLMGAEAGRTIEKANPALFLAMGIFAIAFLVLLFVKIPEPQMEKVDPNRPKDKYSPLSFRHFVLGTIAIFVYVGVEVGIPSTANLYLTTFTEEVAKEKIAEYEKQQAEPLYLAQLVAQDEANLLNDDYVQTVIGKDSHDKALQIVNGETCPGLNQKAGLAGMIVGLYWLLMLIGRFVGASIGAKVSSRKMMIVTTSVAILLLLAAILSPVTTKVSVPVNLRFETTVVPLNVLFLILCGLCTSIMWGSIFNLAVQGLGKYTKTASGIFMVLVCGGGIIPLIQGRIADSFGFINSYWLIILCVAYMLFYALIGCKNVNTDIPVED